MNIERFWNFKKYPKAIFYYMVPLAIIGFSLTFLQAALEWYTHGDPWYFVIALFGVLLLCLGLWPIRHLINKVY